MTPNSEKLRSKPATKMGKNAEQKIIRKYDESQRARVGFMPPFPFQILENTPQNI
jgi:hypothetical protein